MSDQNNQNPLDEVDEDLLSMIQRWTEETQRVKEAKREQWRPSESDMNKLPRRENPWATDLNHAADRALQDDTVDKLPSLHYSQPQQQPQQAFNRQTDYQPQPEPKHPSESKKVKPMKKRHPFKRFISFLLVFVLIIGVGGYVLAFNVSGKVDRREISDEDRAALFEVNGTTRVTNILLMGVDTQGGGARADTMLLLSIDKVHKKLKLTSFLRDSWLQLANGNSAKLNSAVDQGGPALAMRTVSKSFNVRVDHFVQFSFESFSLVIDDLGGVSVPIEKDEIDFLCKNTRLGKQIGSKEMKKQMDRKGAVKLTGEQALIFCRIRKLDDDFQRTERQRRLLNSMMQAMKKNPLRVFGLLNGEALSTIQTDMSQARMANLAITSPLFLGYDMEEFTVPVKGTWSYATKRGTSVITMNTSQNAEKLYKFIYEK